MLTHLEALSQLHSLQYTGLFPLLTKAAAKFHLPVSFIVAVASRETNAHNILGDFRDGEFHGVGLMQIDIQHEIARLARNDGSWKTQPGKLIDFGAGLLRQNVDAVVVRFTQYGMDQHLKIVASGYNCGLLNAIRAAQHGDSDVPTTRHNYGADVVVRMHLFQNVIDVHAK